MSNNLEFQRVFCFLIECLFFREIYQYDYLSIWKSEKFIDI